MKRLVGMAGFTIAETFVVLAVTGALFVAVTATLAGRQRNNEFIQASNDAKDRLQQVISQAQEGYYPGRGDFSCAVTPSHTISLSQVSAVDQGKNSDCVFLGSLLQFNEGGTDKSLVRVYPVTGLRKASDIASADPSVVRNGAVGPSAVDASTTLKFKYGLSLSSMSAVGPGSIGSLAILSSLDSSTPGESGDQQFDIYAVATAPGAPMITDAYDIASNATKNPVGGIKLCFESGGTNQWAKITIGNKGSKLSVDLDIKNGTPPTPCV